MSYLLVNCGHIDGITRWHVSSSKVSDIGRILDRLSTLTLISCGHKNVKSDIVTHQARIQLVFFFWGGGGGLRLSAIFFCLLICPGPCNNLDPLLKFLYEPPPPSECTNPPPPLNPGSAPADHKVNLYYRQQHCGKRLIWCVASIGIQSYSMMVR